MQPGEKKYPHVFSPFKIGDLEVKNRIKYASTETNFNYGDGFVSEKEIAYMEAQARGGAGIVTTQGAFTDPRGEGKGYVGMMGIWNDEFIPGLKRINDVIHQYDSKSILQLMHCGRVGGVELDYTVGPSMVKQRIPRFREPKEMTVEEIETCIQEHIDASRRCQEAGYDGIEISGIVGYLISNFISKYTNQRTDEYGGDPAGRATFMRKIVEGIRKQVGEGYPIIIRLCGEELLSDRGGNEPEESLQVIKIAEQAGIDCLSVTAGWQESAVSVISRDIPMGHWLYIAERMKKNLKVPVAMAYRLFYPELAEQAIIEGKLDIWEMCRPMIADPYLPLKILEDRQEEIIPCMACNICLARLFRDAELNCFVRPSLGHESEPEFGFYGFDQAPEKKKVWIVGAGIAGMQAGAIAAEKGHDGTITDKADKVGGQLAVASNGPWGDEEFMRLVDYLEHRCKQFGAKFELGREVTRKEIKESDADAIIVATGAEPHIDVKGADLGHVVSCLDVFEKKVDVGKRVVILGDSGAAISTALLLVHRGGHEVTLVGKAKKPGQDVNPSYIWRYMKKLKDEKAAVVRLSEPREITERGVVIDGPDGEQLIEADTVIIAYMKSNDELSSAKKRVYSLGDAITPRRGSSAIQDGYKMGMRL
ncbi:MAG: FAD-dependent oxidoreductase [Deltaproteobacteria bacterium]|jgi:2,4-dienoyl-CoA reductase (NADPH2)|nr:FAD-dependent oxidoreductase [Deltaproteobacteria bacterium]MBW2532351.1 FAD-dependent oxidoreductase [Deltaproteobacteria bacterium]